MKFVIRAGGIGTRLWPFSRREKPKQFHALVSDRSMLQTAVERIDSIAALEDVYVSTGSALAEGVTSQLPDLVEGHLIVEPALRNTGPAVGLECVLLEAAFPGCIVASLGSDHHIGRPEEFCRLLKAAESAVSEHPDELVLVGVKPTRAETGFGYIQKGEVFHEADGEPVYRVGGVKEKPDLDTAGAYVSSGDYLWNANMFVWRAGRVLELLETHEPDLHAGLMEIKAAVGTSAEQSTLERVYPGLKEIAIDNAVLERADRVAVVEADIDWSDIGSWSALADVLPVDEKGNLLSADAITVDSTGSTVYAPEGKLVALIGVDDLVVVDAGDALLVVPKDMVQRVREVVDELGERDDGEKYL
ncbi:MAG: mannose-1-phosphate guanylyltransferase [Gemmatimonadetes bacterium]|nr:mannose-1-phosphate guanylyltransferase [Gemmatimonadota bacterium]